MTSEMNAEALNVSSMKDLTPDCDYLVVSTTNGSCVNSAQDLQRVSDASGHHSCTQDYRRCISEAIQSCTSHESDDDISSSSEPNQQTPQQLYRLESLLKLEQAQKVDLQQQIYRMEKDINRQKKQIKAIEEENKIKTNQLDEQYCRFYRELQNHQKIVVNITQQRNRVLNDNIILRNQISRVNGLLFYSQQKICQLQYTNQKIIDDLNFEKELLADYKMDNISLRAHLKNMKQYMEGIKIAVEQEKKRTAYNTVGLLTSKIEPLGKAFYKLKQEIQGIQKEQTEVQQAKKEIINVVYRMKAKVQEKGKENCRSQNSLAKPLLQNEKEFRSVIQVQQQKIKELTTYVNLLKSENLELQSKSKFDVQSKFYTNSAYVSKMIKDSHKEFQQIKGQIATKEDQIFMLEERIKLEKGISARKTDELQRLTLVHQKQKQNLEETMSSALSEKARLYRKIEQLNEKIASLKAEVREKDSIITSHISKSKSTKC